MVGGVWQRRHISTPSDGNLWPGLHTSQQRSDDQLYNRVSLYIQGPTLDLKGLRTLPAGNQVLMGTCHNETIILTFEPKLQKRSSHR